MYTFLKDHAATMLVMASIAVSTWTSVQVMDERITQLERRLTTVVTEVDLELMGLEGRVRTNEKEDAVRHAMLKQELELHIHGKKDASGG